MHTIGMLSKKYGLSRSTLLYYDSIGLLQPSERTAANYRRYSEEDAARLEQICLYRETGMALADIKTILESAKHYTDEILEKHLSDLNKEIKKLEIQRRIIVHMLKNKGSEENAHSLNKDTFVSVLRSAGIGDKDMEKLHVQFEILSPNEHQAFLEFLGMPQEEIKLIRELSQKLA